MNTDYVIRSAVRGPAGRVTFTIIDMAGRPSHVTVPYDQTGAGAPEQIVRAAIAKLPPPGRR